MTQKGLLNYWQEPWNWLEMMRCLHGIILFLLLVKCVRLLRINKVMAPCVAFLRLSRSTVTLVMVAGIVVIIAYTCLGNLLFLSESYPFSTVVRSFQTVLLYFLGMSEMKTLSSLYKNNRVSVAWYYGTFFFIMTVLWAALLKGVLNSLAQEAKKSSRSKYLITFTDIAGFIWEKVLAFIGQQRQNSNDSDSAQGTNPILEDDSVGQKVYRIEQKLFKNHPEIYDLLQPAKDASVTADLDNHKPIRSELELQTFRHLHQESSTLNDRCGSQEEYSSCQPQSSIRSSKSSPCHNKALPAGDGILQVVHQSATDEESSCVSISDGISVTSQREILPTKDHFNLAKLGNTLPHVLCGTKCPKKQVVQSQMLDSQRSSQQRCASASAPAKSHKPLKRSQTTIIEPLETPTEVLMKVMDSYDHADRSSGSLHDQEVGGHFSRPANQLIDFGLPGPNSVKVTKVQQEKPGHRQKKKSKKGHKSNNKRKPTESSILYCVDETTSKTSDESANLPGSIQQCW
nr:PREDICTED: polycystic kidney disease protein 1-like 1 isoform X2 [Latimeria chalumnae]|eukprot:XP_006001790.1 PREDICTED: polycystic kidney disease protein 1-like 1 isoform X2 [Latimeria chalumnae]